MSNIQEQFNRAIREHLWRGLEITFLNRKRGNSDGGFL
jgi:hypothetical protein